MHDSFYIGNDHIQINGKKIRLPKLGWIKMREELRFHGEVKSVTIRRIANKWFASVQVESNDQFHPCESQATVGVDLGINSLVTTYDGDNINQVSGVKPLKQLLKKLQRAQRQLSRKQKGSCNRAKQRDRVANLHYRIRCMRQESLHQLTRQLTKCYQTIVIEDLNVKGMLPNSRLARSIADMGFYGFRRLLEYKAALYGNQIKRVDRWFPSSKRCSNCHEVHQALTLKDREFECSHCGLTVDRDANAAMNLYTESSSGIDACGEESAGLNHG